MWSPKNPSNPTPPLISIDWSLIKEKVRPDLDHDRLTTVESGSIFLVKFFACTIPLTCFFWGKENCCLFLLLSDLNSVQFSAFFKFYVFLFWFQQGACWSKKVLDGNHYVRLQISYWYLWGDKIWSGRLQSFLRQQSGSWGDRKWWVPWREGYKGRRQCGRWYKD